MINAGLVPAMACAGDRFRMRREPRYARAYEACGRDFDLAESTRPQRPFIRDIFTISGADAVAHQNFAPCGRHFRECQFVDCFGKLDGHGDKKDDRTDQRAASPGAMALQSGRGYEAALQAFVRLSGSHLAKPRVSRDPITE